VAPLPDTQLAAQIPFYVVIGVWVLLELRVRLRSRLNRRGARLERGSLLVLLAAIYVGLFGGFELAEKVHAAAIADGRWPFFVVGIVLMCAGIAIRQWAVALLGELFTIDVRVHPGQSRRRSRPLSLGATSFVHRIDPDLRGDRVGAGELGGAASPRLAPHRRARGSHPLQERALLAGLGEPYRRFAATRPHLFPGLW
jgi:protein-S-isoprenylcysteine O-methyltransferase Ste14